MAESVFHQKNNHTAAIWIAVLILLIVLLLTLFWLAPLLWGVSDSGSDIIPLFYDGDRQIVNKGTLQYITAEEKPGMITHDDNVQWEIETDVDLFKTEYTGPDGSITVRSDNGDKVIAPGTTHEYRFSLKNTGNISLDYTMELASLFTLQNHDLPIRVRLKSGDKWIVGSDEAWEDPDELESIVERSSLDVGRSAEYVFEWLWPFEDGIDDALLLNDLNDVIAANAAVEQEVHFQLEIRTISVVTPGAAPSNPDGTPILVPLVRWNFLRHAVFPGMLLGISLILILLWRTPIYITGFAEAVPGTEFAFGRKKDSLRLNGRFVFKKIYTGRHTLTLGMSKCQIRLKRSRKAVGILFEEKDGVLSLAVPSGTRALELYPVAAGPVLTVRRDNWAVIDSKHRVFTPLGAAEPVNQCNRTPGGLTIDKNGTLDVMDAVK